MIKNDTGFEQNQARDILAWKWSKVKWLNLSSKMNLRYLFEWKNNIFIHNDKIK